MLSLNEYLDKLSIIKVLSFFLLLMLVLTLVPMLFNFSYGNLLFKLLLYGIMFLFFFYKLNNLIYDTTEDDSLPYALKRCYNSIFKVSNIYQISFIVISNILFVAAVFFALSYLSSIWGFEFSSHLFGDFSQLNFDVLFVYFLTVVVLSPIIEELLFRGIFLRRFYMEFKGFEKVNGLNLAILLSSIIFGICHGFGGISGAILFGICVSILYIKSRNILVPIFAHFLNNLLSFLLALSGVEYLIQGNGIVIAAILILAVLSNVILFTAIFKEWPQTMV